MSDTTGKESSGQVNIPPYVSSKTLESFFDKLAEQGVPSRIDRSMLNGYSGAVQSQLMSALRYLRLITDGGQPTQLLKDVVASRTDKAKKADAISSMLLGAYPFLKDEFLATATTGTVYEELRNAGASGDTVRKCLAFLVPMAREAGFSVSGHIKNSKSVSTGGSTKKRAPRQKKSKEGPEIPKQENVNHSTAKTVDSNVSMSRIIADKMPTFDPTWTLDAQANWLATAKMLLETERGGSN